MIIYKVTNLVNQKIYIGQSINSLEHRRSEHYRDSKRTDRPAVYFHKALLKYGYASFKWEVIEELDSLELLNEREIYWISFYNSSQRNKGYNLKHGGQNGGTCCLETKNKIGKATKERWNNPEIAKQMKNGLSKGTQTVKNRALSNYKQTTCKQCGKNFTYRPCDTSGTHPTFCSKECLYVFRVNNKKGLEAANLKNAQTKQEERERLKIKIQQWLPKFEKYKDLPLNGLTPLFSELSKFTGYKDPRSIMLVFGFTSRKLFYKELSKMYAELTGNCKS